MGIPAKTASPAKAATGTAAKPSVSMAIANGESSQGAKSGIKTYKAGEQLFREKDAAESLYIIQKGQVRLFLQKGKGFVDIAILRAGEVIGEMAYFDAKASRRSCSAEAMVQTEVVEITFKAFDKTMQGVNPWFRMIVNTLADRLRKTNDKVKALESNSVGFGADGKVGNYVFFHSIDVVKMLSLFYLVFKAQGDATSGKVKLHQDKLKAYMIEIFNIPEVKFEEFMTILKGEGLIAIENDEAKLPKLLVIASVEEYKSFMNFFNAQRMLEDSKKLVISLKCQVFLAAIIAHLKGKPATNGVAVANIGDIMGEFKQKNIAMGEEDLADSARAGLTGDIVVNDGVVTCEVQIAKLEKQFPNIRLMNAVKKINDKKAGSTA